MLSATAGVPIGGLNRRVTCIESRCSWLCDERRYREEAGCTSPAPFIGRRAAEWSERTSPGVAP